MANNTAARYNNSAPNGHFSVPNFVPEIWTGRIMANMEQDRKLMDLVNRDWEGEIKGKGDKVYIYGVGRIHTANYVANDPQGAVKYETAESYIMDFTVGEQRYWAFKVEDIEKAQSKAEYVEKLTASAAAELAKDTERFIYKRMIDGAAYNNLNGCLGKIGGNHMVEAKAPLFGIPSVEFAWNNTTDADVTTTDGGHAVDWRGMEVSDLYEAFVDLGTLFDDDDLPTSGRYVIVPTFLESAFRKDPRFIAYGADADASRKMSGNSFGEMNGFEIIKMPTTYFKNPYGDESVYKPVTGLPAFINQDRHLLEGDPQNQLGAGAVAITDPGARTAYDNYQERFVGVRAYVPATTTAAGYYRCIAGIKGSVTYAEQFTKTETVRLETYFADAVRGLLLFGAKSLKPNELVTLLVPETLGGRGAVLTRTIDDSTAALALSAYAFATNFDNNVAVDDYAATPATITTTGAVGALTVATTDASVATVTELDGDVTVALVAEPAEDVKVTCAVLVSDEAGRVKKFDVSITGIDTTA